MGDLSKNFSRSEFACKCGCGFDTADHGLVYALQECAEDLGIQHMAAVRIVITSGCRCTRHNTEVGGAPDSQHIYGRAADFKVYLDDKQLDPDSVDDYFKELHPGLSRGIYSNRNHIDSRSGTIRAWDDRE